MKRTTAVHRHAGQKKRVTHCLATMLLPLLFLAAVLPAGAAGGGWDEVGAGSATGGGISDNDGISSAPAMVVAPDGTLYVAWHDDSDVDGDDEVYVRRWNGSEWSEVGTGSATGGGISDDDGTSREPALAIGLDGVLYVAWHDNSAGEQNYEIYVRRWDGDEWAEVGAGSASGGGISGNSGYSTHPSMSISTDGTVYVAWSDDTYVRGKPEIYVRKWDGDEWAEVGPDSAKRSGISHSSGISVDPSMAIGPDGALYVAWSDDSLSAWVYDIYVRQWAGNEWTEVGTGSASGGGISDDAGSSRGPSVATGPDGAVYVAWEDDGNGEIYVRQWAGSEWAEVGTGSASGGGISHTSGDSESPTTAVARDGTVYVAWTDDNSGDPEIYVRHWNGSSWEEVGEGSATGGGISHTSGESRVPAVAVDPDGHRYVAWSDYSSGDREIYVRQGPPELEAAPGALLLLAEVGGANPAPRAIATHSLGRAITWTATLSPAAGWLEVSPISGTTPATVTATADVTGLGVGPYTTQILIQAEEDVAGSPQTVTVKLSVAERIYEIRLPLILRSMFTS